MPDSDLLRTAREAGEALLQWVRRAWEPYPDIPDTALQRQLVLRASREFGGDTAGKIFHTQPTFAGLDKEIADDLWIVVLFFWAFFPLLALAEVVPLWRVRRGVIRHWREWRAAMDPECRVAVLDGEIRRQIQALPKRQRKGLKGVEREARQVFTHWKDFHTKLRATEQTLLSMADEPAERLAELSRRISAESDPVTLASLQRQFAAICGSQEARTSLLIWRGRLEASRDECEHALVHLRSRLTLLAAAGEAQRGLVTDETVRELHATNAQLAATQQAAEEVLLLRS